MACCMNTQYLTKFLNLKLGFETLPDRVTNSGACESGSSFLELSVFVVTAHHIHFLKCHVAL